MDFLKSKEELINLKMGSVNESVFKKGDIWGVKTVIDVPKSIINGFISKAKKEHGIDPKEQWGDAELAELFVKYITTTFMNVESLPVNAILGDVNTNSEVQTTIQPTEVQTQEPVQTQTQEPVQTQEIPGDIPSQIENPVQ